jgi:hypothetical protein
MNVAKLKELRDEEHVEIASSSGERVLGLGETLPYVHRACDRGCGEDDYLHLRLLGQPVVESFPRRDQGAVDFPQPHKERFEKE